MIKKRNPLHSLIAGVAFAALVLKAYAYHDIANQNATREAIALLSRSDPSLLYEEIYLNKSYAENLIKGTYSEDYGAVEGNERSFRHCFDPQTNTGVAFYSYFPAWKLLGAEVTEPPEVSIPAPRNGQGDLGLHRIVFPVLHRNRIRLYRKPFSYLSHCDQFRNYGEFRGHYTYLG